MMKLDFITQEDPLYILPFFEEFFRHYSERFQIRCVYATRTMGKRTRLQLLRELIWLYGISGFARLAVRRMAAAFLSLLPGAPLGKHHSLAQLCKSYGVPCVSLRNPNGSDFVARLRNDPPDLLVSVACPYILKPQILESPRLGCINIHNAPLPRYKGMLPVFWQLYHGEKTVGITVHFMVAKIDEGPIVLQEQVPVSPGMSLDELMRFCKRIGAHSMARAIQRIETLGSMATLPVKGPGSYFSFPHREHMRRFRELGWRAL